VRPKARDARFARDHVVGTDRHLAQTRADLLRLHDQKLVRLLKLGPVFLQLFQAHLRHAVLFACRHPFVAKPGATFNYNGGSTALLGEIIERSTNEDLVEYARKELFAPLHISDFEWRRDFRGNALAYSGLQMRPRDLLKIGRLLLDRGQWRGRQIISAQWVDELFRAHLNADYGLKYSYHWWLGSVDSNGKVVKWVGGIGNGGQRLFILPELDVCVVVTAGRYNQIANVRPSHIVLEHIVSAVNAV